jgi:hypothetical protein
VATISELIDFDKHNNQALNLLIGFCSYATFRTREQHKKVVETLFSEKIRVRLFRDLKYNRV